MQADSLGMLKTPAARLGFFLQHFAAVSLVSLFCFSATAQAHESSDSGSGTPSISATFKQPAGVDLRVQQTTAYQFALATDGKHQVEILDDHGRAFIRLANGKVEADLNTAAWFRAQQPGGGKVPKLLMARKDLQPEWSQIAEQTGYGWYDKRLVEDPPKPFQLKMRVDGKVVSVPIRIAPKPVMHGFWQPEITQSPDLDVTALIPGVSGSVIMLSQSLSAQKTLKVLDDKGQSFLELRPDGVWANQHHKWYSQLKVYGPSVGQEDWVKVSQGHTVTYQDPRIEASWPAKHNMKGHWKIQLLEAGSESPAFVEGEVHWQPVKH